MSIRGYKVFLIQDRKDTLDKIALSVFFSGFLLGSGPCLATCGPVLIFYVAAAKQNSREAILVWLLFSIGRISVYLGLSISIFLLGELLVRQNLMYIAKYVSSLGAAVVILIGVLTIIKDYSGINRICTVITAAMNRGLSGIQPVTLGLIMGLLPCAPLFAVLSYIALIITVWQECIFYSLIFGLGTFISPLILLVLGAGMIPAALLTKPTIYRIFRFVCGFIIIFFGVQLIF